MGSLKTTNNSHVNENLFELNVLLVGNSSPWEPTNSDNASRINLLGPVEVRDVMSNLERDSNIDLLLIDEGSTEDIDLLIEHVKDLYSVLPIVTMAKTSGIHAMEMMKLGVNWHFSRKEIPSLAKLSELVRHYIFKEIEWEKIFERFKKVETQNNEQFLDAGLAYKMFLEMSDEEKHIIRRLFPHNRRIHIFPLEATQEPGLSGAKVYRVQADDELMRIVKLETISNLATITEKYGRLIGPRINQYIGRMELPIVRAQYWGGASYILAKSEGQQEVSNIKTFLNDRYRVKQEAIDDLLEQLYWFLKQLYVGSVEDRQVRFWAEYYSRILPPTFQVKEAQFVFQENNKKEDVLSSEKLVSAGAVYTDETLSNIQKNIDNGLQTTITLHNFEISELNPQEGIIYVQDDVVFKQRALLPGFVPSKDLPLLRFKVVLQEAQKKLLTNPLLKRGKKITLSGIIEPEDAQISILNENIQHAIPELIYISFNMDDNYLVELEKAKFIEPIKCLNILLWEIGQEDFIKPGPIFSPVIHGDINFKNILVAGGAQPKMWLIDFADARYGHIYFDLAKIEAEFRAHVLAELFKDMVEQESWTQTIGYKMAMLIEHLLFEDFQTPEGFVTTVKDMASKMETDSGKTWWQAVYDQNHLYWEHLLFFLAKLRIVAQRFGSLQQYKAHYPVALFFHTLATLKFKGLDPKSWSKKLVLISSLVAGTKAIKEVQGTATKLRQLNKGLRKVVAAGLIIKKHENGMIEYLLHYSSRWNYFHLAGGEMIQSDPNPSATLIRELKGELNLKQGKDYELSSKDFDPIIITQFSNEDYVFMDYDFHIFKVEIGPSLEQNLNKYDVTWVNIGEIENLHKVKSASQRQAFVSPTTKEIFQRLGLLPSPD